MQIKTFDNQTLDITLPKGNKHNIADLIALPAVIDPHVHFRTPGLTHKEDWLSGARVALRGGATYVFDMPNTIPPTMTQTRLIEKKALIDSMLQQAKIPLRYQLFLGADKNHLTEIAHAKQSCIGIKVFMGCSTGNLVIDDDESLHKVFEIAARENMLVAVHAEDEQMIVAQKKKYQHHPNAADYAMHSTIRSIEVATTAVAKAIRLSEIYGTKLYILHVSSADELTLIRDAKEKGLPVFAETTPHHLFFDDGLYETAHGFAQVNPPLRAAHHHDALIQGIHEGIIDTIGSDHAPHTRAEKQQPYGACPSGMPGLEFMLPMLLNAYHQQIFSLTEIVALTSKRVRQIFTLPHFQDWVIVNLKEKKHIQHHDTVSKCGHTPYAGQTLQGWPVYTVLNDVVYDLDLV